MFTRISNSGHIVLFTRQHAISHKRLYEGIVFNMTVDELRADDGSRTTRETIEHNGGVVIACQPTSSTIILVKQYRYSIDSDLIEFPAGRLEKGEDPLAAAKRELKEETGYIASIWKKLSTFFTAPGFCNELLHLYHAQDVVLEEKCLDADEETEVIVLPLENAWKLVAEGKIHDAKTIAGLGLLINAQR